MTHLPRQKRSREAAIRHIRDAEALVRQIAAERGLRLVPAGVGFHISGPGVDLLVTDFRFVRPEDLRPD